MPAGFSHLYGNSNVNYKIILKKENKVGEFILQNFKTYYKVIVTKRVGIGIRINKNINKTESRVQK